MCALQMIRRPNMCTSDRLTTRCVHFRPSVAQMCALQMSSRPPPTCLHIREFRPSVEALAGLAAISCACRHFGSASATYPRPPSPAPSASLVPRLASAPRVSGTLPAGRPESCDPCDRSGRAPRHRSGSRRCTQSQAVGFDRTLFVRHVAKSRALAAGPWV